MAEIHTWDYPEFVFKFQTIILYLNFKSMDISHDFQFKIQNKIMATLFELNNHVTISKLKFKLGDNLITNLIP